MPTLDGFGVGTVLTDEMFSKIAKKYAYANEYKVILAKLQLAIFSAIVNQAHNDEPSFVTVGEIIEIMDGVDLTWDLQK